MSTAKDLEKLEIVEHVSGVYSYHLAEPGKLIAVCGATGMMRTQIPIGYWGTKDHLPSRWCRACFRVHQERSGVN